MKLFQVQSSWGFHMGAGELFLPWNEIPLVFCGFLAGRVSKIPDPCFTSKHSSPGLQKEKPNASPSFGQMCSQACFLCALFLVLLVILGVCYLFIHIFVVPLKLWSNSKKWSLPSRKIRQLLRNAVGRRGWRSIFWVGKACNKNSAIDIDRKAMTPSMKKQRSPTLKN